MLIGHKDEIEHYLTELFLKIDSNVIGGDYVIIGTVEKKAWHENMKEPKAFNEIQQHIHDFKSYQCIRMTMAGWFRKGEDPPQMQPPISTEWVK